MICWLILTPRLILYFELREAQPLYIYTYTSREIVS